MISRMQGMELIESCWELRMVNQCTICTEVTHDQLQSKNENDWNWILLLGIDIGRSEDNPSFEGYCSCTLMFSSLVLIPTLR